MKLIERVAQEALLRLNGQFPVLLLTGARQVGKTTLFQRMAEPGRRFVSLDNPELRKLAQRDPSLFLQSYPAPLVIDEIQYAPELLPFIKIAVDAEPERTGMYWLTGSQPFRLMKGVSESLAGRVAVFPIGGIAQGEEAAGSGSGGVFVVPDGIPDGEYDGCDKVFARIHRGAFPVLVSGRIKDTEAFYRSYVQTYLERDIRDLTKVSDISRFHDFIAVAAARTGQLLNLSNMAADVGVSVPTAKAWLSLLETSGLVYLLHPYSRNITARIVKTPKLYFLDTGLACHLAGWTTVESLARGAMAGAMLETFVVSEIIKRAWNAGVEPRLWFYRDKAGAEVDLLIERDGALTPVEIKKTAAPTTDDARHFAKLREQGFTLSKGAVVALTRRYFPIAREVVAIPVGAI